jgi:hypothetical protein
MGDTTESEEELDGMCDPDLQPTPTQDDDIDGVVLFADVDPSDVDAIERRTEEWKEVFRAE